MLPCVRCEEGEHTNYQYQEEWPALDLAIAGHWFRVRPGLLFLLSFLSLLFLFVQLLLAITTMLTS